MRRELREASIASNLCEATIKSRQASNGRCSREGLHRHVAIPRQCQWDGLLVGEGRRPSKLGRTTAITKL